jgi:hypothetical protein
MGGATQGCLTAQGSKIWSRGNIKRAGVTRQSFSVPTISSRTSGPDPAQLFVTLISLPSPPSPLFMLARGRIAKVEAGQQQATRYLIPPSGWTTKGTFHRYLHTGCMPNMTIQETWI